MSDHIDRFIDVFVFVASSNLSNVDLILEYRNWSVHRDRNKDTGNPVATNDEYDDANRPAGGRRYCE